MTMRVPRLLRGPLAGLFLALVAVLVPSFSTAHDIPTTVLIQAFVRPEGNVLRFLVRAPLGSMRDIIFPTRGPGFLRVAEADPFLDDAAMLWMADYVQMFENGVQLATPRLVATRISLPSDRSFSSYETALANVLSPRLPDETELVWQQALVDVLFEYDIQSADSRYSIHSGLANLGLTTTTVLRFVLPGSNEHFYQFTGDIGLVDLDPTWVQATVQFVETGFLYILDGIDHLLFLLCLVVPFRRLVPLVTVVGAFTIAQSITLFASALGYAPNGLWFPPAVETLIAASIVFVTVGNFVGANLHRRWLAAFGFGLIHGFGFWFALRESLQFGGSHPIASLLSFNLGAVLGQVAVLLVAVPALSFLFHRVVTERLGIILVSALVTHIGWHWMADRWANVRRFTFQLPPLDAIFLLGLIRWLMAILALVGVAWVLRGAFGKLEKIAGDRAGTRVTPEA